MAYFDAGRCPVCAHPRAAHQPACTDCGQEFADPRVAELGRTLQHADRLTGELLTERRRAADERERAKVVQAQAQAPAAVDLTPEQLAAPPSQPPATPPGPAYAGPQRLGPQGPGPQGPGPQRPGPQQGQAEPREGRSVGWVLLAVGALLLTLAGGVFVAVTWQLLSWPVRALILLIVTAISGVLGEGMRRKGLRASAEALSAVASGFWIVTLVAAVRSAPDLSNEWRWLLCGLGMAAGGFAVDQYLRRVRDRLALPDVLASLGWIVVVPAAISATRDDWYGLPLTLTAAAGVGVHCWLRDPGTGTPESPKEPLRLPIARLTVQIVGAIAGTLMWAIGWAHATMVSDAPLLRDAALLPLALIAALVVAWFSPYPWVSKTSAAVGGLIVASFALGRLVNQAELYYSWLILGLLLVVGLLGAWTVAKTRGSHARWGRVARYFLAGWGFPLALFGAGRAVEALGLAASNFADLRSAGPLRQLSFNQLSGPYFVAVLGLILLALRPGTVTVVVPRLPTPYAPQQPVGGQQPGRPWLRPVPPMPPQSINQTKLVLGHPATPVSALAVAAVLLAYLAPLAVTAVNNPWLLLLAFGLATALLLAYAAWRDLVLGLGLAAWTMCWLLGVATAGGWVSPATFFVVTALCAAWGATQERLRWPAYAGALLFGLVTVIVAGKEAQIPDNPLGWGLAGAAVVLLLLAPLLTRPGRSVLEGAAALWGLVGFVICMPDLTPVAIALIILGAGAGIASNRAFVRGERGHGRVLGWGSGVLLTASLWLRLNDAGVTTWEWFTVPPALALLGWGVHRLRHDPTARSYAALLPALTLGLGGSWLIALGEPTSLRALIVGIACLVVLVAGLAARLGAPFVFGAATIAVLGLVELWPYQAYVPRWVLLACAGALLVFLGVTWEARLRDIKAANSFVGRMR